MSRSLWKPKFYDKHILSILVRKEKVSRFVLFSGLFLRCRRSCIPDFFIKNRISVYNGRTFVGVNVLLEFLGTKFGEYSFSKRRSIAIHLFNKLYKKKFKKTKLLKK